MARAYICGRMEPCTRDYGKRIKLMALVFTNGQMEENLKVFGKTVNYIKGS